MKLCCRVYASLNSRLYVNAEQVPIGTVELSHREKVERPSRT